MLSKRCLPVQLKLLPRFPAESSESAHIAAAVAAHVAAVAAHVAVDIAAAVAAHVDLMIDFAIIIQVDIQHLKLPRQPLSQLCPLCREETVWSKVISTCRRRRPQTHLRPRFLEIYIILKSCRFSLQNLLIRYA